MKLGTCNLLAAALLALAACGHHGGGEPDGGGADGGGADGGGGNGGTDGGSQAAPGITTLSVADAVLGKPYSQALGAHGGVAPLIWSLESRASALAWLSIDPVTGALGGTPNQLALTGASFTVRVQANDGQSDSKVFVLTVRQCNDGEVASCAVPSGSACLVGTQQCSGGQFGACSGGTGSADVNECGSSCGACGPSADTCVSGRCQCGATTCTSAQPTCCEPADGGVGGALCVDTQSDVRFCGSCATPCDTVQQRPNTVPTCATGACTYPCAPGYARCPVGINTPGCNTNTNTDSSNCGGCGNACPATVPNAQPASPYCQSGSCKLVCNPGWADCNGSISDGCEASLTSASNCGACGHAVDFQTDVNNCGSCGHVCPAAPSGGSMACVSGTCTPSCPGGYNLCNNATTCIINTDMNNCGGCGVVCPTQPPNSTGASCATGTCKLAGCDANFADCDGVASNGCEADLMNDGSNCGGCGNQCGQYGCGQGGCCDWCGCCGGTVCTPCGPSGLCCY